jgi:hypothetical protein
LAQETSELSAFEDDKSTRSQWHRLPIDYIDGKQKNKTKISYNSSQISGNSNEDTPALNFSYNKGDLNNLKIK